MATTGEGTLVPEDVGASEQLVDQWQQRIQQRAERYQDMAARMQGLSLTEASKDGLVRVTITSNGILTNVEIAESAREKRMFEISAEIMKCLQRAQSRIPELLQQVMAETIGTQDETANVLFAEAKKHFPQPPADEAPPPPPKVLRFGIEDEDGPPRPPVPPVPPAPAPRRHRRAEDDDDFGDSSFLS